MGHHQEGSRGLMKVKTGVSAPSQSDLFDVDEAQRRKEDGMTAAASGPLGKEKDILAFCRKAARKAAEERSHHDFFAGDATPHSSAGWISHTATIDDAYRAMEKAGIDPASLGPAAGSVFRGDEWVAVGWQPSERTTNHGRVVRVWRLK